MVLTASRYLMPCTAMGRCQRGDGEDQRSGDVRGRVMIFQGGDIEWHFDRMAKDVRSFAYTQRGDRYLLLGFDWATKRIKSSRSRH